MGLCRPGQKEKIPFDHGELIRLMGPPGKPKLKAQFSFLCGPSLRDIQVRPVTTVVISLSPRIGMAMMENGRMAGKQGLPSRLQDPETPLPSCEQV